MKHLNQPELAERRDRSDPCLERLRSEGIGPVFMKLQGRVLYRLEDIEAFETEGLRQRTSDPIQPGSAA